jgi:hypothetical protein
MLYGIAISETAFWLSFEGCKDNLFPRSRILITPSAIAFLLPSFSVAGGLKMTRCNFNAKFAPVQLLYEKS